MEKLDIIVVPLSNAFAVLPAVMVRQILPSAPLMPPEDDEESYILGSLIVRNDKLTVIDAGRFLSDGAEPEREKEKLIWFSPMQAERAYSGFILRAAELPQFVPCREGDIIKKAEGDHPLIAQYVQVRGLVTPPDFPIFIIDLVALGKNIAQ